MRDDSRRTTRSILPDPRESNMHRDNWRDYVLCAWLRESAVKTTESDSNKDFKTQATKAITMTTTSSLQRLHGERMKWIEYND